MDEKANGITKIIHFEEINLMKLRVLSNFYHYICYKHMLLFVRYSTEKSIEPDKYIAKLIVFCFILFLLPDENFGKQEHWIHGKNSGFGRWKEKSRSY